MNQQPLPPALAATLDQLRALDPDEAEFLEGKYRRAAARRDASDMGAIRRDVEDAIRDAKRRTPKERER